MMNETLVVSFTVNTARTPIHTRIWLGKIGFEPEICPDCKNPLKTDILANG